MELREFSALSSMNNNLNFGDQTFWGMFRTFGHS